MSNVFFPNDPRRPYRRRAAPSPETHLTVEDYEKLAAAYQELKGRFEQQVKTIEEQQKQLTDQKSELAIKDEALQRQGADLKQSESNLLWTRAALEQLQKEQAEGNSTNWEERYLDLQAEVENLRKRWEQRYAAEVNEARNRILADMLPLADHLDLALQHASTVDATTLATFVSNIEATRRAFLETLKRYGVERLEAQGQPFDPSRHEAVGHVVDGQVPAAHVAHVVQAGYLDGDRVVRPARVVVSKGA
ncbi:MAG TPA: nucleotide exchange factor GrpE [Caldilineaceae bacterium]|nr:nucleotide exchange factor GrpE [Caldilineaceae bacterium]